MTDRSGLVLDLERPLAERLRLAAHEAGLTVEAYVRDVLSAAVEPLHDWSEADRALAEYDRTGESYDAGEVLSDFVSRVEARARRP